MASPLAPSGFGTPYATLGVLPANVIPTAPVTTVPVLPAGPALQTLVGKAPGITSANIAAPLLPSVTPSWVWWVIGLMSLVILGLVAWLIAKYLEPKPKPTPPTPVPGAELNGTWRDQSGNYIVLYQGSGSFVPPTTGGLSTGGVNYAAGTNGSYTFTVPSASSTGSTVYTATLAGTAGAQTLTFTPGNAVWTQTNLPVPITPITPTLTPTPSISALDGTWTSSANNATITLSSGTGNEINGTTTTKFTYVVGSTPNAFTFTFANGPATGTFTAPSKLVLSTGDTWTKTT